jgi:hypothetical protein
VRGVTPAMTVKELQKHDIVVNEKQAKTILDFLYLLADNTVQFYFNEVD